MWLTSKADGPFSLSRSSQIIVVRACLHTRIQKCTLPSFGNRQDMADIQSYLFLFLISLVSIVVVRAILTRKRTKARRPPSPPPIPASHWTLPPSHFTNSKSFAQTLNPLWTHNATLFRLHSLHNSFQSRNRQRIPQNSRNFFLQQIPKQRG